MISEVRTIQRELNHHVNLNDAEWIISLSQFPIDRIKSDVDNIFTADLKKLESRLTEKGLDNSYRRMQSDVDYRIAQAYLHTNDERTKLNPQLRFILGRIIICTKVVLELLKGLHNSIVHLVEISNFLSAGESFHTDRLNTIFEIGRLLDKAKGYEREIENIIEDYLPLYRFNISSHGRGSRVIWDKTQE